MKARRVLIAIALLFCLVLPGIVVANDDSPELIPAEELTYDKFGYYVPWYDLAVKAPGGLEPSTFFRMELTGPNFLEGPAYTVVYSDGVRNLVVGISLTKEWEKSGEFPELKVMRPNDLVQTPYLSSEELDVLVYISGGDIDPDEALEFWEKLMSNMCVS